MEPVELTEDDILLRPWRPEDADAVYAACQDPEIQRWTTVPSPYLAEHAARFVGERSPKRWADGSARTGWSASTRCSAPASWATGPPRGRAAAASRCVPAD